jgi:hypothetical protein
MSTKIKFITSIYSDLYMEPNTVVEQTEGDIIAIVYLSILKMTNADFLCYTSDREIDALKSVFL